MLLSLVVAEYFIKQLIELKKTISSVVDKIKLTVLSYLSEAREREVNK
jgi:hypothetical protein